MITRRLFQDESGYDPTAYDPSQQGAGQQSAYTPYSPSTPQPAAAPYGTQTTESRMPLESSNVTKEPVPATPATPPVTPTPPPATPATTPAPPTPSQYAIPGWSQDKWGTQNDPKYNFGYILSQLAPTDDNLKKAVDQYNQTYGSGASYNGGDTATLAGVPVDFIFAHDDPSQAHWQYILPNAPGDAPASSASKSSGDSVAQLKAMMDAGMFGQPSSAGVFGSAPGGVQQVGQDPFSNVITDTLGSLIENNGQLPDTNGQVEALNLENARQQADRARQAEYSGVLSQLANRGLLPEGTPGGQGGLALDALGRIENNDIAPQMSAAVRSYMINDNNLASGRLMDALSQGTNRQSVLSNIALQTLSQNTAFNEFLAQFGLDRDKTLAQLAQGQDSSLLMLLQNYLGAANSANNGFI